jgi:hypothetical protein
MKTLTKEQLDADTLFAFQMALKGHKQFEYHNGVKWSPIGYIVSSYPHRIYHDIPEGWTRHDGEDWNGDKDAVIEEVMWMDGKISSQKSRPAKWWRDNGGNSFTEATPHRIYAYKLAEKPEKKVIPWTLETCPRNLWVKRKGGDSECLAIAVCKERGTLYLGGEWVNFYKLMSDYLQPDNSPCGTEVGQ